MNDPYIYPNGVLINLLGITDEEKLKQAEVDITLPKIITAGEKFSTTFDKSTIKGIHKHIFGDIYPWAGEFRTINISKIEEAVIPGISLTYGEHKNIEKDLDEVIKKLEKVDWNALDLNQKSMTFTKLLSKIWKIHPFREGNTRTVMTFGSLYAKAHGFPIDMSCLLNHLKRRYNENGKLIAYNIRDCFLFASLEEEYYPEPEHLSLIMKEAMESGSKKKNFDDKDER